uniref:Uncharacterized protein n=1 Tax=Panagrellus redivivus TaxID=6233 RepID=A0A7E5A2B2_PANRE
MSRSSNATVTSSLNTGLTSKITRPKRSSIIFVLCLSVHIPHDKAHRQSVGPGLLISNGQTDAPYLMSPRF